MSIYFHVNLESDAIVSNNKKRPGPNDAPDPLYISAQRTPRNRDTAKGRLRPRAKDISTKVKKSATTRTTTQCRSPGQQKQKKSGTKRVACGTGGYAK